MREARSLMEHVIRTYAAPFAPCYVLQPSFYHSNTVPFVFDGGPAEGSYRRPWVYSARQPPNPLGDRRGITCHPTPFPTLRGDHPDDEGGPEEAPAPPVRASSASPPEPSPREPPPNTDDFLDQVD